MSPSCQRNRAERREKREKGGAEEEEKSSKRQKGLQEQQGGKKGDLKGRGDRRKTRSRTRRSGRGGDEIEAGRERHPGSSAALNLFDPVGLARRSSRYIPVAGWAHGEEKRHGETEGSGWKVISEESRKTKVCWWELEDEERGEEGEGPQTRERSAVTPKGLSEQHGGRRVGRGGETSPRRSQHWKHTHTHKRARTGTDRSGIQDYAGTPLVPGASGR